jgi:hypothetical protein
MQHQRRGFQHQRPIGLNSVVMPTLRSGPVRCDHVIGVEFAKTWVGQDGLPLRIGQGLWMVLARELNKVWSFHLEGLIMEWEGLNRLVVR